MCPLHSTSARDESVRTTARQGGCATALVLVLVLVLLLLLVPLLLVVLVLVLLLVLLLDANGMIMPFCSMS